MDKSIPAGAAYLLEFIYKTETGKTAPGCYEVIFGRRQNRLTKPLTEMTLAEVQAGQKKWKTKAWAGSKKASSAAGAGQFMEFTLRDLIYELRLSPNQKFDGNLQDRLAYHLLKRRGYEAFMAGKISRTEFGKRLAMEWASFPLLAPAKGAHRDLPRGVSYYEGDSLNKALVPAVTVEHVLDKVRALGNAFVEEGGIELPDVPIVDDLPEPKSKTGLFAGLFAALAASLVAVWSWVAALPCNLINVFCGG